MYVNVDQYGLLTEKAMQLCSTKCVLILDEMWLVLGSCYDHLSVNTDHVISVKHTCLKYIDNTAIGFMIHKLLLSHDSLSIVPFNVPVYYEKKLYSTIQLLQNINKDVYLSKLLQSHKWKDITDVKFKASRLIFLKKDIDNVNTIIKENVSNWIL